jgi:Tfp pilus assembly protein PilX
MGKATHRSRGFTLIASLLLLLLLSAIAVGLMYTVTGSGKVGSNDLEANTAYYGAESGMEKLTADLASLYQQKLAPTQADLTKLAQTSPPSSAMVAGMTYVETAAWSNVDAAGNPITTTSIVSQGAYAGLTAEIIPMTLQVSAIRPSGASVNMTRGVEIALVPVFQFGVFSDSDITYFAGPEFSFLGRVHTNGNLYLTSNHPGPLVLGDKITAVGQIMRDRLPNNYPVSAGTYDNSVYVPNTSGGCDAFAAGGATGANPATCPDLGPDANYSTDDSSWSGGIPPANGALNTNFASISQSRFNSYAVTGVPQLQMPFVQGSSISSADSQIEIIRKQETAAELVSSPVGSSREYNKANIHVLLGDNENELYATGVISDAANDVHLETLATGVAVAGVGGKSFFALADQTTGDPNLIPPRCKPGATATAPYPIVPESTCQLWAPTNWPLVRGWLRVEYLDKTTNTWIGITNQWLGYGFTRNTIPPTKSVAAGVGAAGTNNVHPYAILLFQQLADRDASGTVGNASVTVPYNYLGAHVNASATESTAASGGTGSNYYPINFFDPREGYPRDPSPSPLNGLAPAGGSECYVNGIMNAVELDVGNLTQWLAGNGVYSTGFGPKVNSAPQNGYLVYFSDRRGEMPNPNATPTPNVTNGESGLEDVINSSTASGMPDGAKEPITAGYNSGNGFSPEDVDEDGVLDNWGGVNIGDGFGKNTNTAPPNPYAAIDCVNGGRQNWVSGARHVLRLVDGTLGNLPLPGFTVAAENPVYVLGDYNSNGGDTVWNNPPVDQPHSAAAVIADALTLLSNNWSDLKDMQNTNNLGGRTASSVAFPTTSYRLAISAGKNMNFPYLATFPSVDFGTDGGVHNFLRYIESWGGNPLQYRGSLVSMYYSEYATGIFKCCNQVYSPPDRKYSFDKDFLVPANLPPGTPMLQDIDTLSYWQNFNPCTTQTGTACTN